MSSNLTVGIVESSWTEQAEVNMGPPFHGILRDWRDWAAEETLVDLVAVAAPTPPRFPWEVPVAVALIVAGLALLLL